MQYSLELKLFRTHLKTNSITFKVENRIVQGINCLHLMVDGKREGLGCLYKLFAKDLFRYGLSICGNENEVSECIHDFFVFLWDQRSKLAKVANPKAYLMVSFKRRLIKQLEKNKGTDELDIRYEQKYSEESYETDWIKEETHQEHVKKLTSALSQLSGREREVIQLKYYEKYTNEEIATHLEINNQSVRNLLYRAIQNLRKKL